MSGFLLANVLDAARSLGPKPSDATPEAVRDWFLSEYLAKRGGGFNYDPASFAAYELFRGAASKELAVRYCKTNGNPKGREQNASAIAAVADYALANISRCHRIGFLAVEVGRAHGKSVYVGIKAPFMRVIARDARVIVPGFRMSHRPNEAEIDVVCGITRAHLARDDYAASDIEYLHAGPGPDGKRLFRPILGRERTLPSADEVDGLLDVYVRGIALLMVAGLESSPPNFKGYQVRNLDEPLFR